MSMHNSARSSTVVGVFEDHERARAAIEALKDHGFDAGAISVLSPDKRTTQKIADDTGSHAGSGAATGAVAGGILGGLGGWLVGIGALAIPGVGPFIAAGAFATALGGAAVGAGVGAIAGALVGMGVPEEHAKYYEDEAKAGRTLVTVRADGRYDEAQQILREYDAYDVESRHPGTETTGADSGLGSPRSAADGGRLQLHEEELVVHKQPVESGHVEVSKNVVTEQRTIEVPVTREELTIERTPVERTPSDRPLDEREQSVTVPIREEQVEIEKRPVVYEEVGVGTREIQDTQRVGGTVRREEARIEREGDVNVAGDLGPDAEPAYRYGHEMRRHPDYRGRSWSDVEPEFQRDWTQRNPGTPWERVKNSIRDVWDDRTNA
jgi:uncharacterized protein (TIGR02271 family)